MTTGTLARAHRKLTEELIERAYAFACMGMPFEMIARGCGVSYGALRHWLKMAEKGTASELEFKLHKAIREATVIFQASHVQNIIDHSKRDAKYSTWILSHSPLSRDQWSDSAQTRREVAKVVGMFVEVLQNREGLSQQEREGILLDLRAKGLAVEAQELPLE